MRGILNQIDVGVGYTSYMNSTIDKHKFFPVIAWGLVLGFVFFTYSLTLTLTEADSTATVSQDTSVGVSKDI
jgi:hypothetical protein